jgi:hypothetical protein
MPNVLHVLRRASGSVVWLSLLEMTIVATDSFAAAILIGPARARVSWSLWMRSASRAYAAAVLLPAGRAVGETLRATVLQEGIELRLAASVSMRVQTYTLLANALVSLVAAVVLRDVTTSLAIAVAVNGVLCGALGGLLSMLGRTNLGPWVLRVLRRRWPESDATVRAPSAAFASMLAGRLVQMIQYGLALRAVGGIVTPLRAVAAQAVHLVGAAVGDLVPGQLGVMEGSYDAFSDSLGLADALAPAVAIPLLMRAIQIGLAATCVMVNVALFSTPRAITRTQR